MTTSTDATYAERLRRLQAVWWKRVLDVQMPYRLHLRRLKPGFVLDVGCGIGRNLAHIDGHGVGVDPNADAVASCRARGLTAFTPGEFETSEYARDGRFDTLLVAHVLEHMPIADAVALVSSYLRYVRTGGRAIFITPQEAGYRSDHTHVEFVDLAKLDEIATRAGLVRDAAYSFPFPRLAGKVFKYNEFVLVAHKR